MIAFAKPDNIIAMPTKNNEWFTPACYIEAARSVMGSIDLDPASCQEANGTVRAKRYYTKEDNGLSKPWYGRVWCNPPYSRTEDMQGSNIGLFVQKLMQEYGYENVEQAIILVTSQCDAKWFKHLWNFPICFTDHRVHFITTQPTKKYPTRSHVLGAVFVYLGPNNERFAEVFSEFGPVIPANVAVRRQQITPLSLWEVSK